MRVRIAKAHVPVTALGWGRRAGIWMQGCGIGCPGCLSRDTWAEDASSEVDIGVIDAWLASAMDGCDGLTISGGEPFDQPEALTHLAESARRAAGDRAIDVLVYSGRRWDHLAERHADVLRGIDAVISEPFEAALAADDGWRGSTNQQYHALTAISHERGPEQWSPGRRIQVTVDEGSVWMVGIPRHGDLVSLERTLSEQGVEIDRVSWRP